MHGTNGLTRSIRPLFRLLQTLLKRQAELFIGVGYLPTMHIAFILRSYRHRHQPCPHGGG